MTEELKEYMRKRMKRLRRRKKRVRVPIEGVKYKYKEVYVEKELEIEKCPFCTMILGAYHDLHPCERWVILMLFKQEQE